MRTPGLVPFVVAFAVLAHGVAAADDKAAAKFFDDNCAGCHTIGGGAEVGPDLRGVTSRHDRDWLLRFVMDPDQFASDPAVARMIGQAGGTTMPVTPGLTRGLAGRILDLIDQRSGTPHAPVAVSPEPAFTAADVARGRELFTGALRLSGSGPACIACHESGDVAAPGGGRLGPDLTRVVQRLGGARGLETWLGSTPTPMMRAVFRHASLTRPESSALAAFLAHSATASAARRELFSGFVVTGVGGAAGVFLLIGVVWAKRFGSVRRPLVTARGGRVPAAPRNAPGAAHAPRAERDGRTGPEGSR